MGAVVVDLGGTQLRCGVARRDGQVADIERLWLQGQANRSAPAAIWSAILSSIEAYAARVSTSLLPSDPIVVAFPGPIRDHVRILSAPTIHGDVEPVPDLCGQLGQRTGRPVYLLNDVSAAAWHVGRDPDLDRFFVVTISSGIGSKLFDRAHAARVLDHPVYAGEIGHVVVDDSPDAPMCDCGGRGHLGAIASGRGVEAFARREARRDPAAFARSACATRHGGTAGDLSNEGHLVPSAREGDPWAVGVIREASRPLARVLLTVVLGAGVQKVVIIGGFALALGARYLEVMRGLAAELSDYHVLAPYLPSLLVLGHPDSCLLGAARFAEEMARAGR